MDEGSIVSDQFTSMSSYSRRSRRGKQTCEKQRAELLLSKVGVGAPTMPFGKFDATRAITYTQLIPGATWE